MRLTSHFFNFFIYLWLLFINFGLLFFYFCKISIIILLLFLYLCMEISMNTSRILFLTATYYLYSFLFGNYFSLLLSIVLSFKHSFSLLHLILHFILFLLILHLSEFFSSCFLSFILEFFQFAFLLFPAITCTFLFSKSIVFCILESIFIGNLRHAAWQVTIGHVIGKDWSFLQGRRHIRLVTLDPTVVAHLRGHVRSIRTRIIKIITSRMMGSVNFNCWSLFARVDGHVSHLLVNFAHLF